MIVHTVICRLEDFNVWDFYGEGQVRNGFGCVVRFNKEIVYTAFIPLKVLFRDCIITVDKVYLWSNHGNSSQWAQEKCGNLL